VEEKDAVTVSKKGIREIRELEEKGRYVIYLYRDLESGEVKEKKRKLVLLRWKVERVFHHSHKDPGEVFASSRRGEGEGEGDKDGEGGSKSQRCVGRLRGF